MVHPRPALALHTELIRLFFTRYLVEFRMNIIGGQGRGGFLRSEIEKDDQAGAEKDKSGIEKSFL